MRYDIVFEGGCRSHDDCWYNGVDASDSNGPPKGIPQSDEGIFSAFCTRGGTCACTQGFYGPGCTRSGRGHHTKARLLFTSGNLKNLICNYKSRGENGVQAGLTASVVLNTSCSVS